MYILAFRISFSRLYPTCICTYCKWSRGIQAECKRSLENPGTSGGRSSKEMVRVLGKFLDG
eukprot:87989-Amorphochlora_amoeboformis.AAC.1